MKQKLFIMLVLMATTFQLRAQNMNKKTERALKKAIGYDLDDYKIYSYPTNNFGLGTSCDNKWKMSTNFLCDTWRCLQLPMVTDSSKDWINLFGYASMGEGGPIKDSQEVTKDYVLGFAMPKIFQIISIGLNIGINNNNISSVTINKGIKRFLDRSKFDSMMQKRTQDDYKNNYDQHKLVVVTSDFIFDGFSVTINLNDSLSGSLDAKIGNDSLSQILSGDSLQIKVKRVKKGQYQLSSPRPIIFAVAVKKQPHSGGLKSQK